MTHPAAETAVTGKDAPRLLPDDEHNRLLLRHTHPPDWVNPTPKPLYDLVVLGAGTAGLTAAGGCAAVGGTVALIERKFTGGDCLISGCVPSKGLISASRVAAHVQRAGVYGIRVPAGTSVDFPAVMERMRRLRAQISPADSVEHLAKAGVDVFLGDGRFVSPEGVEVIPPLATRPNGPSFVERSASGGVAGGGINGARLRFKKAVIATGGRADVPPIPGLKEAGYLTNETLFELTAQPRRLVIIGGGPIGCEMAQTFRRFGSDVIVIHNAGHILNREDADAAAIIQQAFVREGIQLVLSAKTQRVERRGDEKAVTVESSGRTTQITCDAILISAGRAPNLEGLNLEAAGVAYEKTGVTVNDRLQTTNARVFAAGDISAPFKFTHTANALGRMAMINALFWGRNRMSRLIVPWCTYTDPEIAHVGLYEQQAKERGYPVTTLTVPLRENDRAVLDGEDEGFVRVHLKTGTDQMLGATVVAAHAGDLLSYFTLAMTMGKGLSTLAGPIYPYPTQAEVIKRLANTHLQTKLKPWVKRVLRAILAIKR